jgi:NurA-like 5'-3' nuclease
MQSSSLYQDYKLNEPAMFYLNSGREIAQVQVPKWVTEKPGLLDQVHAMVYAQCQNGGGYPTVLTRSHEQAVVTAADREMLDDLVLAQLNKLGIKVPVSEKARSKQVRGI